MRHNFLGVVVLVAAVGSFALATTAAAGPSGDDSGIACIFNMQLEPEPGSTSEAKGHAQIKVLNDGTIEYNVFILNKAEEEFQAGHIHVRQDPSDFAGPPLVFLFNGPNTSERQIRVSGEVTAETPADVTTAENICAHPELYYVNFHTNEFFLPIAALRGELAS